MTTRLIALLVVSIFSTVCSHAEGWTHWRGESGNSVSLSASPPTQWSSTENVKWKTLVPGRGSGSPVIWKDQVFVVSAVPRDQSSGEFEFKLFSFDRETGKLRWEQIATILRPHEGTHSTNGFASASPCTDGVHVYAHFGSRGIYCYTIDGELVWKRDDLGKMRIRVGFGEGSSPVIEGDTILVPWDHEGPSFLLAMNKLTGETIWKAARDEPTCWATPLVVDHNGGKQVVMNGQNNARAYDFESGKELWRCGGQTQRPVASPVHRDGVVFVGSGFRGQFLGAFRLGGSGDIEGSQHVVWTVNRDTPDIASLTLSETRLYYTKAKTGVLTCVDAATGERHFGPERTPGIKTLYASPIAAGGHVYLTGRNGRTVVVKDSTDFELVSSNDLGEGVDATPAPVDDELFIRGANHLFCIAEQGL